MKKMLALLASTSLTISSAATVGCTIGDNAKYNTSLAIQRVILASSLQSKAAIINSENHTSASYLLNSWGNDSIANQFGSDFINDLGGQNTITKNLFLSVFGSKDYSITNKPIDSPSEQINVTTNMNNPKAPTSINPKNGIVETLDAVSGIINVLGNSGIGTDIGSVLGGLLDMEGGSIIEAIKNNIGILDTISDLFSNNEDLINSLSGSLSWDQFKEFIAKPENQESAGIDNKELSKLSINEALTFSYMNLAHSINITLNEVEESDPNINNLSFATQKLINGIIKGTLKFDIINILKGVVAPIITHLRIVGAIYGSFDMNHQPMDSNHLFDNLKTNEEIKKDILDSNLWSHESASSNYLSISGLFTMLTDLLGSSPTKLQKVLFALIGFAPGDYKIATTGRPEDISKLNSLIAKIGLGATNGLLDIINIDTLSSYLRGPVSNLLIEFIESFAYNGNLDISFNKLSTVLKNVTGLFWSIVSGALELEPSQLNLIKIFIEELSMVLKSDGLHGYFDKMTDQLSKGNIVNSLISGFSNNMNHENWNNFSKALYDKIGFNLTDKVSEYVTLIRKYTDKLQNISTISSMPIIELLDTFGVADVLSNSTEIGRALYKIKHWSIVDILAYFNTYFNEDEINYKLHLGDISYVIKVLQNKISINGGSEQNIFDVLKMTIMDSSYKKQIRTIQYSGVGYKGALPSDNLITIGGQQTAMLSILGVKKTKNQKDALIDGSLLSGVSAVMGPGKDWIGNAGVADNALVLNKIISIVVDVDVKFKAGNNAWIDETINKYTNKEKWNIKSLSQSNINDPTKEAIIQYRLEWSGFNNIPKSYTVTVKRAPTGEDIFNSQSWRITSLFDDTKPQT